MGVGGLIPLLGDLMAETNGRPVLVSQINRPGGLAGSAADL
jgi:hypothetical protein